MYTGTKEREQNCLQESYLHKTKNDLNLYHSRMEQQHVHITVPCDDDREGRYYMQDTGEPHNVQWKKWGAKEHVPYDSIYIKTCELIYSLLGRGKGQWSGGNTENVTSVTSVSWLQQWRHRHAYHTLIHQATHLWFAHTGHVYFKKVM